MMLYNKSSYGFESSSNDTCTSTNSLQSHSSSSISNVPSISAIQLKYRLVKDSDNSGTGPVLSNNNTSGALDCGLVVGNTVANTVRQSYSRRHSICTDTPQHNAIRTNLKFWSLPLTKRSNATDSGFSSAEDLKTTEKESCFTNSGQLSIVKKLNFIDQLAFSRVRRSSVISFLPIVKASSPQPPPSSSSFSFSSASSSCSPLVAQEQFNSEKVINSFTSNSTTPTTSTTATTSTKYHQSNSVSNTDLNETGNNTDQNRDVPDVTPVLSMDQAPLPLTSLGTASTAATSNTAANVPSLMTAATATATETDTNIASNTKPAATTAATSNANLLYFAASTTTTSSAASLAIATSAANISSTATRVNLMSNSAAATAVLQNSIFPTISRLPTNTGSQQTSGGQATSKKQQQQLAIGTDPITDESENNPLSSLGSDNLSSLTANKAISVATEDSSANSRPSGNSSIDKRRQYSPYELIEQNLANSQNQSVQSTRQANSFSAATHLPPQPQPSSAFGGNHYQTSHFRGGHFPNPFNSKSFPLIHHQFHQLTLAEKERFERLFREIDRNNNGFIDFHDLVHALERKGIKATHDNIKHVIERSDKNADGDIDFAEFVNYCLENEKKLHILFKDIDINNDGKIDQHELVHAFNRVGVKVNKDEVLKLVNRIKRFDKSTTSRYDKAEQVELNFEEFRDFLLLHPTDSLPNLMLSWRFGTFVDLGEDGVMPVDFNESEIKSGMWWRHMVAGGVAGAVSRTFTAPLDRLKVFLQVRGAEFNGLSICMKHMIKEGGVISLWRGNGINVLKIAPETAIKFMAFDQMKRCIHGDKPGDITIFERFLAGSIAGAFSQTVIYPMEVLKTRFCLRETGQYSGLFDAARKINANGGIRNFYRGYVPNLLGIIPYAGIDLTIYESLKKAYIKHYHNSESEAPIFVCLACGTISSTFGQIASYPLALVRTRMQSETGFHRSSMAGMFRTIYQREGVRGLYRGITANIMKVAPAVSISYVVYEYTRRPLGAIMT